MLIAGLRPKIRICQKFVMGHKPKLLDDAEQKAKLYEIVE